MRISSFFLLWAILCSCRPLAAQVDRVDDGPLPGADPKPLKQGAGPTADDVVFRRGPVVVERGGRLLTAWVEADAGIIAMTPWDGSTGRLPEAASRLIDPQWPAHPPYLDVKQGSSYERYSYKRAITSRQTLVSLHRASNSAVATINGARTLLYEGGSGGAVIDYPQKVGQAYLLTVSGWELLPDSLILASSRDLGVAFDPNSGATFVAAGGTPMKPPYALCGFDRDGALLWRSPRSLPALPLVPVGKRDILVSENPGTSRYKDESLVDSFPQPATQPCMARRLLGNYFLRWYDMPQGGVRAEVFEIDSHTIYTRDLKGPGVAADMIPVQNPANGNLAFLWEGKEGGLYASLTTRFLEPAGEDVLIAEVGPRPRNARSPHISGVYRNDTLFVVWEESWEAVAQGRSYMAADIFGASYSTGAVSAVDESASSFRGLSIAPNPSSTNALISFPPLRGEGSIEVVSLLGERVLHAIVGKGELNSGTTSIDVSGIPAGNYRIVVRDGDRAISKPLIVAR